MEKASIEINILAAGAIILEETSAYSRDMISKDFGVDIAACRENIRLREERKYQERETRRQAARADVLAAIAAVLPGYPAVQRV